MFGSRRKKTHSGNAPPVIISACLFFVFTAAVNPTRADDPSYERFTILTASAASHSRSKEWKPGDGIPLEVSGLEWWNDALAVCIRKGEVWIIENPLSNDPGKIKFRLFASGLHEPLGLLRDGADLLVSQRAEITRLKDRDGDGRADAYLTECDGWNVSGNYHAYTYGPERDGEGKLWVTLNLGMGDLADNAIGWRGWGGTIGKNGRFEPKCFGMRSPCGIGPNLKGDLFFTDQQGTWVPATPVYHLRPGVFYGNQESLASQELPDAPFRLTEVPRPNQPYPKAVESSSQLVPPAVWLPYNKMGRSATDIELIDEDGKFGPFDGQLLVGEFTNAAISRVFLEPVDDQYQGACFPFLSRFPSAVVRLQFAPDGSLLAGMTNRGWSSLGNRSYGLERIRWSGKTPFSVQSIEAKPKGFLFTFTEPIATSSGKPESFPVSSFTYEYSSKYGGEEIHTENHAVSKVSLSDEGRKAMLEIEGLRELYVFEFNLGKIVSAAGKKLDHHGAWYTLNRIPQS